MKAMIWQLKQWTNCKMNKYNLCIFRAYYIIPAFCSLCLNTRGITQNSYGRVPGEQKRPLATTYLSGTTQCIRTGTNYCSNINTFNLYLQKLFWKTRTLELPKFLQVKNLFSDNKRKNKTLQRTRKNAATPNYKMRQRISSPHNTALEGRRPAGSIHRRLKFFIKVLCTLSHNSGTSITQLATIILQVPKSCRKTTLHCWNLYNWSPEWAVFRGSDTQDKGKAGLIYYDLRIHRTDDKQHATPLRGLRNCSRLSLQKCEHSGDLAEILRPQKVLFVVQEYKKPQEKHSCA